jgi:phosphoenolpyruvate carboxylase
VNDARRLRDRLAGLSLADLRMLTRAFSIYFDLINLAEQRARVRTLRNRILQGRTLPESVDAAFAQLRDRGVGAEEISRLLKNALVVPVFTARSPPRRVR